MIQQQYSSWRSIPQVMKDSIIESLRKCNIDSLVDRFNISDLKDQKLVTEYLRRPITSHTDMPTKIGDCLIVYECIADSWSYMYCSTMQTVRLIVDLEIAEFGPAPFGSLLAQVSECVNRRLSVEEAQ